MTEQRQEPSIVADSYATREVTIQALQWDGTALGAGKIIDWILQNDGSAWFYETNETTHRQHNEIFIRTLEGHTICSPEDFVIRGLAGEFYPCKAAIFDLKYYKL